MWCRGPVTSQPSGIWVGSDSRSQFSREYRRPFGAPPGKDARRLREGGGAMTTGSVM
ncbi:MAG: hypothetical protein QOI01_266 [Mycobacterium sp.]|jgi:hypothetical protein|nr:hypothetical protein [Mycobacterium sp.]